MTRPLADPVVHIDDARFKVTEWRFATGAETGWHVHGHDYLTQGVPYSRRVGVAHNVINAGAAPLAFLEVEVVDDAVSHRRADVLARFMAAWNARDLDALMGCMAAECAFHASSGPGAEGARHLGRDAVRAAYAAVFAAYPQAAWTADRHHVAGDTGVSEWRFVGTTAAGNPVEVQGVDLFRFDGDLIALKDSYRKARG